MNLTYAVGTTGVWLIFEVLLRDSSPPRLEEACGNVHARHGALYMVNLAKDNWSRRFLISFMRHVIDKIRTIRMNRCTMSTRPSSLAPVERSMHTPLFNANNGSCNCMLYRCADGYPETVVAVSNRVSDGL